MPGCKGKCIEIKTCLFFCQIGFNSEPSPDLIDTAATSANAMENVVSGRSKMTRMLLSVAAPAFSWFNCMWRSGLKILSVPGFAWRPTSSGKWEKACLGGSSDLPQMLGKVAVCGRKTWKRWAHLPPSCLQQIHTRPQQMKLACLPFFAVSFLSVSIPLNQFLRQYMMLWRATGMPKGTYLYNFFTDHFVSYESEILSGGFISWSPRWIVWEFRVLYLPFKNHLIY